VRHLHSSYPAVQNSVQGKGPMTGNVLQLEFGRRNKRGLNSIYVRKFILDFTETAAAQCNKQPTGGDLSTASAKQEQWRSYVGSKALKMSHCVMWRRCSFKERLRNL